MDCDNCGNKIGMPFKCKFCGDQFCANCRLPEAHNCLGLANISGDEIVYEPKKVRQSARVKTSASMGQLEGKMTFILLGITILIFILQWLVPAVNSLIFDPQTAFAQPWTFVTSIFLHEGYTHLFVNMLFLFMFGILLEKKIGSLNFLIFYLAAGIVANLGWLGFTILIHTPAPALGASGALMGVMAALAVLEPNIMVYPMFIPIPVRIQYALIIFAAYDVLLAGLLFTGVNDGVAHAAHLTGILAGLAYGFWLKNK